MLILSRLRPGTSLAAASTMPRSTLAVALAPAIVAIIPVVALDADAAPKRRKAATTATAPQEATSTSEFDKQAAATAITEVSLQRCRATNASRGEGHVMITFSPAGSAAHATIDKGPWIGSPVAKCMAREFRKTKVPPFRGDAVTVGKTFHFE